MKRIEVNSYLFPDRVGDLECKDKSMTQQSFAEEVDVNNIVARAVKTGMLGDPLAIGRREAVFGDFSDVDSFHTSLNRVIAAQNAFMELPADVRARFNNDPGQLIAFLSDEANRDEAVKLGLVVKKEVAADPAAKVAADAGSGSGSPAA